MEDGATPTCRPALRLWLGLGRPARPRWLTRAGAPAPATTAALIAAASEAGAAIAFLVVAQTIASDDCVSGCVPGSQWAPGGPAAQLQLVLAWSALAAAIGLVGAVGTSRRRTAKLMWTLLFGLMLDWSVFTATITSPTAVVTLLVAGAGGLFAISLATGHRVHAAVAFTRRLRHPALARMRSASPAPAASLSH